MGKPLLQSLGLPKPKPKADSRPDTKAAAPADLPVGADKAAGDEQWSAPEDAPRHIDLFPKDVIRRVAEGRMSDDELKKALKGLPAEPSQRALALADIVPKIGDAIRRDPVVRMLRDTLAKIVPFMSEADAKKKINEAVDSLVEKGIKAGIEALLKAVIGKDPTPTDPNAPRPTGPPMKEKDIGEVIIKTPEIPVPWDKPKKPRQNSFEFRGLKPSYPPSKYFDITVRTPDWFEPYGRMGAGRVIIGPKAGGTTGEKLRDKRIESKGDVKMSLAAPDEPGEYLLYIVVGPSAESHPVEKLTIAP